jgi:hypothetical protein
MILLILFILSNILINLHFALCMINAEFHVDATTSGIQNI